MNPAAALDVLPGGGAASTGRAWLLIFQQLTSQLQPAPVSPHASVYGHCGTCGRVAVVC